MLAKIPPSLAAVAVGILMVKLMPIQVNTIGDLYTINSSLGGADAFLDLN